MINFSTFSELEFLDESLKSPIEFEMTDDTNLPKQVFSTFNLDGTQYGMSLILSNYDNVYMLDFYRIVNVKKRSWSFMKQSHIRTCLSTVIKFMEASYPFLTTKMKGVIIDIPGKTGSEKYVSFLGKVLKRSFIKKFVTVPVTKKTEKARNYLFLVRKDIQPASLFKTAAFHKNFDFDKNGEPIFDTDMLGQTDTYKTMKQTVSINPSKKYAYGAIQVELVADGETVQMLDDASEKFKIDSKTEKPEKKEEKEKEYEIILSADMKDILSSGTTGTAGYFDNTVDNTLSVSLAHLMAVILPNAHDKILSYGYDESKVSESDLKYSANEGFKSLSEKVKAALKDAGMFTSDGSLNTSPVNMDSIKLSLASMMYVPKNQAIDLATIMNIKLASTIKKGSDNTKDVKEFKMDLEKFPASPLNSFESANLPNTYNGDIGFYEDNEDVYKKKKDILKMPSIKKWYEEFDRYSGGPKTKSLYEYTGSTYRPMNKSLRQQIIDKKLSLDSLHKDYGGIDTLELIKYFREAPEIQNGIWVYRNADTPGVQNYDVGDDYTDAAIMSTSINSRVSMGSSNQEGGPSNTRLKIYLPKGTKCFPILDKSSVSSEGEVVLPPFSLFRIMERYDNYRFDGHRMFVCTYIGTGMEHYLEAAGQEMLLEGKSSKPEKEIKSAEGKWSDPTISYEDSMAFKKLVLKLNKNKK